MQKSSSPQLSRTVLLVNTGTQKKRFILQRLKKLGVQVIALNKEKNWAASYVNDWIIADTAKHDETIRAVGEYLKTHTVDGIVTFWEDDVLLTAKLCEKYHFVGIPYKVAERARNKLLFRQFCQEHDLPFPKYTSVSSESELNAIAKKITFPVVIKPAYGSSSAYVIKADTIEDLRDVYAYVNKNLSTRVESALKDGSTIIVEEYIDGNEVDIDILLQNGKIKFFSISDNLQTKEPFFLESGYSLPSSLPDQIQKGLIEMAELVLEKLGVMHGCIHFEAKSTDAGPVPLEVNLRLGGDEVYPAVKKVWKVDLIDEAINIACGRYIKIIEREEPAEYVASQSLTSDKPGILSKLFIPKKFDSDLNVDEFHFDKEVGDTVFTPPVAYDFLGWCMVSADNPIEARENLEEVLKQVSYEIVPFSPLSSVGKTARRSRFSSAALSQNFASGKARIEKIRLLDQKNQRRLHIGVACNTYSSAEGAVEAELTSVGKNIEQVLRERGYQTTFIDFNDLNQALEILKNGNVDLVFNVGERLNDSSLLEPHIASIFDAMQIPYTGSNPFTLGLCIDKIKVKKLLTFHNIPTARWDYAYDLSDEINPDLRYPLIVKPANTDNSIGITNDSVVVDRRQLEQQLEYVITSLKRPALVEEYLDGDEYDVSIIGSEEDDLQVLPLARTTFTDLPEGYWHICPFDAKFLDSELYKEKLHTQIPPKNVNQKLLKLITEIALDTYNILDCHDYGRVEIKLDKEDNPYILELNPNPSINKGNRVPTVAELVGMDYGDFLEEIIALAIKRYKNKPPYYHLQPSLG